MPTRYEFSLRPVSEPKIPTFERILDRARALTSTSANWTPGKTVHGVKTFSFPSASSSTKGSSKGPRWWVRVSQHSGGHTASDVSGFDELWRVLSKDKFITEQQYNPDLLATTLLKSVHWGEVWSLHSAYPTPISPRTCTVLSAYHLENSTPRIGWLISIPFEVVGDETLKLFVEHGVTSRWVSVERIRELDNGKVEWLAVSSTSMSGSIPLRLSEYFALKRIVEHPQKLISWLDKQATEDKIDKVPSSPIVSVTPKGEAVAPAAPESSAHA